MEKTRIEQDCIQIVTPEGDTKYRITSTVIDKGELPFPNFFLFNIPNPDDPADDEFVRVAAPVDIQEVKTDRTLAVLSGDTQFLAISFVKMYTDLETAIEAKSAVRSRIDSAVSLWFTYDSEFRGSVDIDHPTVDPAYEEALKNAYAAARDARIAAATEVDDANQAIADAQVQLEHAIEIVSIREAEVDFCTKANQTYWAALQTALTNYDGSIDTFFNDSKAFFNTMVTAYEKWSGTTYPGSPAPTDDWYDMWIDLGSYDVNGPGSTVLKVFRWAREAWTDESYNITKLNDELVDFCGTASSEYAGALGGKNAAEAALNAANVDKQEAEAKKDAAQQAEDEALAAVEAVCPDFDTSTV